MKSIDSFLIVAIIFLIAFGFWYGIFSFIYGEGNVFVWPWWYRLIYVIVAFTHWTNIGEKLSKKINGEE